MARIKTGNKLNVVVGTKSQIDSDTTIPNNSIIIKTDENESGVSFPLEIPAIDNYQPGIYFEVPTGSVDAPSELSTGLWVDQNRTLYYSNRKRLSDQTTWFTVIESMDMVQTNRSLMGYYDGMVVELLVSMTVKHKENNNYYQNTMLIPYELVNFESSVFTYRLEVLEPLGGNLAGYVLFRFQYNPITGMSVSYNMFDEMTPDTHDCEFAVRLRRKT